LHIDLLDRQRLACFPGNGGTAFHGLLLNGNSWPRVGSGESATVAIPACAYQPALEKRAPRTHWVRLANKEFP
ncbi:MAG TPA: hypothetical protein PLU65_12130, partial [Dokdonella sp.]|nr:hypothetical protein [Dokdonella sp.]